MDIFLNTVQDKPLKSDKMHTGEVYFDKKDELLPSEGYFNLTFFVSCFKEIVYKSIPRIFNFIFNLMTMSLINIYLIGTNSPF